MRNMSFLLCAGASTWACLAPPPGAAAFGATAPAAGTPAAQVSPTEPGDLSKPLLVWNGDDVKPTAQSWADCDSKPCTSVVEVSAKGGASTSAGLTFRVETSKGWAGFGWNWTSWYAAGAANAVGRKQLKFMLQIEAENVEASPELDVFQVGLRCAKAKQCGVGIAGLKKYEPAAADGKWHEVSIPLAEMKPEKGVVWDPGSVWEITLGAWAPTPKKYVIHLDDIRFE